MTPLFEIKLLLERAGLENPLFEARQLAAHAQKHNLDPKKLAAERISRKPLQYILGEWDFYGCSFKLTHDVLIPRPETELLAEAAVLRAPQNSLLLDLCTGSGCVAVSVLKHRPDMRAAACDVSEAALAVAAENAAANSVAERIKFFAADLFGGGISEITEREAGGFDVLTANPPYLTTREAANARGELSHEPRLALDGGADGLDFYRRISKIFGGSPLFTLLEAGINQAERIKALYPGKKSEIIRDYAGIDRIVIIHNQNKGEK